MRIAVPPGSLRGRRPSTDELGAQDQATSLCGSATLQGPQPPVTSARRRRTSATTALRMHTGTASRGRHLVRSSLFLRRRPPSTNTPRQPVNAQECKADERKPQHEEHVQHDVACLANLCNLHCVHCQHNVRLLSVKDLGHRDPLTGGPGACQRFLPAVKRAVGRPRWKRVVAQTPKKSLKICTHCP